MSFKTVGEKIIEGAAAGLYVAGTRIMAESQELVPVDTGTLKRSGRVELPVYDGLSVSVTLGYGYGTAVNPNTGQPASGYAVVVHEDLEAQHAEPTQAKFLQVPAERMAPELPLIVEQAIRDHI